MRTRPLAASLAWLAATTVGAAVVWVGLRPVLEAAVPDRSVPISASDLRQLANQPPVAAPTPGRITPSDTHTGTPPGSVPLPGDHQPAGSPTLTGSPNPVGPPPSPTPSTTPHITRTMGPATTTSPTPTETPQPMATADGWTVTTAPDGTPTYQRSFTTPGGTAVIRMVPGKVSLVSATPNPAYTVRVTRDGQERLVVQFLATSTTDTVDAIWWVDHPYASVTHV